MGFSVISKPLPTHLQRRCGIHRPRCSLREPPRLPIKTIPHISPGERSQSEPGAAPRARTPSPSWPPFPLPRDKHVIMFCACACSALLPTPMRVHANNRPAMCIRQQTSLFPFLLFSSAPPRPSLQIHTRTARRRRIHLASPLFLSFTAQVSSRHVPGRDGKGVTHAGGRCRRRAKKRKEKG